MSTLPQVSPARPGRVHGQPGAPSAAALTAAAGGPPWLLPALGVLLLAAFAPALVAWISFAWHDDLHSYVLLVPVVSVGLAWPRWPGRSEPLASAPDLALAALALAAFALGVAAWSRATNASSVDVLSLTVFAGWLAGFAVLAFHAGRPLLRRLLLPLALLLFAVPFPSAVRQLLESGLQQGSAAVATLAFRLTGTPVLREDLVLTLPGFTMAVAPQCSGIRSTVVLLITAVVAAPVLLRRPSHRVWLLAAVVPLAVLRNGLRVFVIGELCVRVGPQMVHSPLHERGGPLFFALSLIPFCGLAWWLRARERRPHRAPAS